MHVVMHACGHACMCVLFFTALMESEICIASMMQWPCNERKMGGREEEVRMEKREGGRAGWTHSHIHNYSHPLLYTAHYDGDVCLLSWGPNNWKLCICCEYKHLPPHIQGLGGVDQDSKE